MRSYWEEDLAILSAENVHFSVETAGLGSRFAAACLDLTIQGLVLTLALLGVWGLDTFVWSISEMPKNMVAVGLGLSILFVFLLGFGYYFFFEWLWDGQTPGKRRLGLRVMMADGMPLTVWPALTRNVVRIMDSLPVCYGVGTIVCILNPMNQRAGDLVAGTIVARERKRFKERKPLTITEAVDAFLTAATTVPGTIAPSGALQDEELAVQLGQRIDPEAAALTAVLNREDYELTRDFLTRKDTLPALARTRLARSLGQRLAAKMKTEAPQDLEVWLEDLVTILSRAYGR